MLTPQLEDAKRLCDDETKERQSLLGRVRNLEHEDDGMNVILEEEVWMMQFTHFRNSIALHRL